VEGTEATRRADAALARLGLEGLAPRDARQLSEGEVQLVAVARALALEPRVLLLDEPASAADRAASARLYRVIEEETARQAVVCFASHQLEDAYRWSRRLVALADGRASPILPENLFRTVLPPGDGAKVATAGPLQIHLVTDRAGPASIAVPAGDIIVSTAPLHSSARNTFAGRVTRVGEDGHGGVTLSVDIGVDLTVRITQRSLEELGITLGAPVVLSFKAMAVRVF
ncbi:MAG: TOBE domain-containing protein, partial [Gemmatimonadetes bacterium]|nr:TOBE domain-containing protein [Gemmatimonadota bacterium]